MQRLCNHKTGIHEVIVNAFWNLKYGLFVVINLILTSYLVSIGNKNLVKDLGFASVFYSAFISYIDLVLSQY